MVVLYHVTSHMVWRGLSVHSLTMGAYLRKPVTDKVSESGEFTVGSRKVLFGATAMQGWRIGMEVSTHDMYHTVCEFAL